MKRIFSVLLAAILLVSALCVGVNAASADEWKDLDFTLIAQIQDGSIYSADMETFPEGRYCMRGFAVSPDGRYLFCGMLNPNASSAVEMIDTTTGKPAGTYSYMQENDIKSYPKGLDCDDRGYLYAGLAYSPNYGTANFAVIDYSQKDSEGHLKAVSMTKILEVSTPGDKNGTKVGINGVAVEQVLGSYYLYVVVNYDVDYLYRYDVNDPTHPILDTTFGKEGRIDLHDDAYSINGDPITEGNYLDVDEDGTIYLGYTSKNGAGMMVLNENGTSVLGSVSQTRGYGVAIYEDYVLCSTQTTGKVCVYNKMSLELLTTLDIASAITLPVPESFNKVYDLGVSSICNIKVANGVLYFADQGSNTVPDQVFATALTAEGKAEVKKASDVLAALLHVEVTEPSTTAAPVTTAPADGTTAAPADETTAAPSGETTSAPAGENTSAEATTAGTEHIGKGCGSAVAALPVCAAALALCLAARKKKED